MTQKNETDPTGLFSLSKDWLAAQQNFMPSGRVVAQFAETLRTITQAEITFGQTVMRANAAFLASLMEAPAPADERLEATDRSEKPSRAAHRPDVSAP